MATKFKDVESRLWKVADSLRANSGLKASEYSTPVLGLIFLKYADQRFHEASANLETQYPGEAFTRDDYQAEGVLYLRDSARYDALLKLPESADLGQAINDAMRAIEEDNEDLRGTLPQDYRRIANSTLISLLRAFEDIPTDIEGDAIGRIYEYFLGEFAMTEGQKGGEFFTPSSLVKLIVEIIEPFHGRIFDPASGSGGMFVHAAELLESRGKHLEKEVRFFGQEINSDNVALSKINLAVHGLVGEVHLGNSYYSDKNDSVGKFDFVMSNPPFNHRVVDKHQLENQPRFPFGLPSTSNANYIWIQMLYSALNDTGRAGFVMPTTASDARASELEIRKQLIQTRAVDVMVAVDSNMFYDSALPRTLWFLDRSKRSTVRAEKVLFIDARDLYRQIDRTHRDFRPDQIEFIANIVRLYRGQVVETDRGSVEPLSEHFGDGQYHDVAGICRVVTLDEIAAQDWSLNPGRYVLTHELIALEANPASHLLSEFVVEMEQGRNDEDYQFSQWDNAIFVSTVDLQRSARLIADSGSNASHWVHLRLDSEKTLAAPIAHFLNSEAGRHQLGSFASGALIPRISSSDILKLRALVPELQAQLQATTLAAQVTAQRRILDSLLQELDSVEFDIWTPAANLESCEQRVTVLSNQLNSDLRSYARDDLGLWLETLPFPIATALRVWQGIGEERPQQKYEQLLKVFEAMAEFLSIIALSAFSNSEQSKVYFSGVASAVRSQHHSMQRASFGTWKIVLEHLGSKTRKLHSAGNETAADLYIDPDGKIPDLVSNKELVGILSRVNAMRNDWLGHSGVAVASEIAVQREETLLGELYGLQELMKNVWVDANLVVAKQCRPTRTGMANDLSLLTGSNSEFLPESRKFERCLETDMLHISWRHSDKVLTLLPFVQIGASPASARNACYFYSKIESNEARFVSFHHRDNPEMRVPIAELAGMVPELFE